MPHQIKKEKIMTVGTLYAFPDHCEIITSPDDGKHVAQAEQELRDAGFDPQNHIIVGEGEKAYRSELLVGSISVDLGPDQVSALSQVISGEVVGPDN